MTSSEKRFDLHPLFLSRFDVTIKQMGIEQIDYIYNILTKL